MTLTEYAFNPMYGIPQHLRVKGTQIEALASPVGPGTPTVTPHPATGWEQRYSIALLFARVDEALKQVEQSQAGHPMMPYQYTITFDPTDGYPAAINALCVGACPTDVNWSISVQDFTPLPAP